MVKRDDRRSIQEKPAAGGTPTTYQLTTGMPVVSFAQWRLALFVQDTLKLTPHLSLVGTIISSPTFSTPSPQRQGDGWS
jgi:hypothetical protein